jgi:hypothetical protein
MNFGKAAGYELILLARFDLKEVMQAIKATRPTYSRVCMAEESASG